MTRRRAQRADAALLLAAQANLKTSQINLDYTEIHAPVDGKIGETALTIGNVVSPSSGALATIVSQDPMYVIFPIPVRTGIELGDRYAAKGGLNAVVIRIVLPDGTKYSQSGKLDFVSPRVAASTDSITLRGTIANPILPGMKSGDPGDRALFDGEFITVQLEGCRAGAGLRDPARGGAAGPAGHLRLRSRCAEQGVAAPHHAGTVDADDGGDRLRPDRGRDGGRGGSAARAPGDHGAARAGHARCFRHRTSAVRRLSGAHRA